MPDRILDSMLEALRLCLGFLTENIGWLVLLYGMHLAKESIPGLVDRFRKMGFSYGDVTAEVELVHDIQDHVPEGLSTPPALPSSPESPESAESSDDDFAEHWHLRISRAFARGDADEASRIFQSKQEEMDSPEDKHSSAAIFYHLMYTRGNDSSALKLLSDLHASSEGSKQRHASAYWLADAYERTKDYTNAKAVWRDDIANCNDERDRTEAIVGLATLTHRDGDTVAALTLLQDRLRETQDKEQSAALYGAIAGMQKQIGDVSAEAVALEKALENAPADRTRLFDAAYAQSQAKLPLLALGNYLTLIDLNPGHVSALNNLGVCAGEFGFNGKRVSFYKKASDGGETLAMANLEPIPKA